MPRVSPLQDAFNWEQLKVAEPNLTGGRAARGLNRRPVSGRVIQRELDSYSRPRLSARDYGSSGACPRRRARREL